MFYVRSLSLVLLVLGLLLTGLVLQIADHVRMLEYSILGSTESEWVYMLVTQNDAPKVILIINWTKLAVGVSA